MRISLATFATCLSLLTRALSIPESAPVALEARNATKVESYLKKFNSGPTPLATILVLLIRLESIPKIQIIQTGTNRGWDASILLPISN
jgi:hypothetical protein